MALYGISSPSGREGKMAMRSKATGKATPVSWRTWTRYTGARQAPMRPILWRTR